MSTVVVERPLCAAKRILRSIEQQGFFGSNAHLKFSSDRQADSSQEFEATRLKSVNETSLREVRVNLRSMIGLSNHRM